VFAGDLGIVDDQIAVFAASEVDFLQVEGKLFSRFGTTLHHQFVLLKGHGTSLEDECRFSRLVSKGLVECVDRNIEHCVQEVWLGERLGFSESIVPMIIFLPYTANSILEIVDF
jgi:hypothetical protein